MKPGAERCACSARMSWCCCRAGGWTIKRLTKPSWRRWLTNCLPGAVGKVPRQAPAGFHATGIVKPCQPRLNHNYHLQLVLPISPRPAWLGVIFGAHAWRAWPRGVWPARCRRPSLRTFFIAKPARHYLQFSDLTRDEYLHLFERSQS